MTAGPVPPAAPAPAPPIARVGDDEPAAAPARWFYVCRRDDIVPNTGVCAKVGATQVAVFRIVSTAGTDEALHAIDNFDPRSGANVLSRGLVGDLGGVVVVASPVYKNHYCLSTGRCLEDEQYHVRTWPVRIADGLVFVRGEPA